MSLYLTDLIAVERNGTSYKETYGSRLNIDKSDALLVEATTTAGGRVVGNKYQCARYEWDGGGDGSASGIPGSTPVSGDLLLVERPSVTLTSRADVGDTAITVKPIHAALSSGTKLVFGRTWTNIYLGTGASAVFTLTSSASMQSTTLAGTGGLIGPSGDNVPIGEVGGVLYKVAQTEWSRYTDIHSANYAVNPIITKYGENEDNSNNYSVVEVQAEFSSSSTVGEGTLYVGFRNTASTDWQGDLPIAAIQILQSNGTTIRQPSSGVHADGYTWNFADAYDAWYTTQATITSKTADPSTVASYYAIGTSPTARRFSYTISGTASGHVGAALGITSSGLGTKYTNDADETSILPVGTANVPQSSTSTDGYLFSECSGSDTGNLTWLACESMISLQNGDRIRICYFGGGNGQTSTSGLKTIDSLFLRYVED